MCLTWMSCDCRVVSRCWWSSGWTRTRTMADKETSWHRHRWVWWGRGRERRREKEIHVPYSRKLSREKTFVVLWLFANVVSTKFGAYHPLARQKQAICKSFLCKNRIFHQFTKVFCYMVYKVYRLGQLLVMHIQFNIHLLTVSPCNTALYSISCQHPPADSFTHVTQHY